MSRMILAGMSLAISALALVATASMPSCVIYNPSSSAPEGWYSVEDAGQLHVGEHVLVHLPAAAAALAAQRGYLPAGIPLVKHIAARAPQHVCVRADAVRIDGRRVADLRAADAHGRPLFAWRGCRRLAADELFLLSETSTASFDSRYFGPVTRERVIGRARPLWTWSPAESGGH